VGALLAIDDVHVHFGGVRALDGASLRVDSGELVGLIGPNGSGKSTLVAVISRLTDVTTGAIRIDGQLYTNVSPHRASSLGIARTFQTVRLIPTMTVLKNVMLGAASAAVQRSVVTNWLRLGSARGAEQSARVTARAALKRVGMLEAQDYYPQHLPYGSQRRVEIARALACAPRILLLDEPVNGMNQRERDDVSSLLLELRQDGVAQLVVEHDVGLIQRICSRVVALNFGKVIAQGTPVDVARDAVVREAYLGHKSVVLDLAQDAVDEAAV
jgi:branched-chain amino acid transport system ATP-binding protein